MAIKNDYLCAAIGFFFKEKNEKGMV